MKCSAGTVGRRNILVKGTMFLCCVGVERENQKWETMGGRVCNLRYIWRQIEFTAYIYRLFGYLNASVTDDKFHKPVTCPLLNL